MTLRFKLTERTSARIRLTYCCYLVSGLVVFFLQVYFVCRYLREVSDPVTEDETRIFARMVVTILFVSLVFESCFLLSGMGAVMSMSTDALQLHFSFSCTSMSFTIFICLVAIWANDTLVTGSLIAAFMVKAAAFALLYVMKHAVVLESEPHMTLAEQA